MVFPHYVLKMFSSNANNSNSNLSQKQKTLLEKKGNNTLSAVHCIHRILPKVVNDTNETILEKITTHLYHGFVLYIRITTI